MSELILTIENKKIVIEGVNENNVSMYVHQLLSENNTLLQPEFYKHDCVPCSDFKTHLIECFKHSMKHERDDDRVLDALTVEFKYSSVASDIVKEKNRFNLKVINFDELIEIEDHELSKFCKEGISNLNDDEYGTFVNNDDEDGIAYVSFPTQYRFLSRTKIELLCRSKVRFPTKLPGLIGGDIIVDKTSTIIDRFESHYDLDEQGNVLVSIAKGAGVICYVLNGNLNNLIEQHPDHEDIAEVVLKIYKSGKSIDELEILEVNDKLYEVQRRGGLLTEKKYYRQVAKSRRFD